MFTCIFCPSAHWLIACFCLVCLISANANLQVSILGEASAVAGEFSKLECVVEGASGLGTAAAIWDPHPVSAMQVNNFDTSHHDLEFAATLEQDARPYRCIGRDENGQSAATVEFNVGKYNTCTRCACRAHG